jgi:hypothetical protein
MIGFDKYYNKKLKDILKLAKKEKISLKEYIIKRYDFCFRNKIIINPLTEFKSFKKKEFKRKECHSFWHRECENKYKECYHCCEYYSLHDKAKFEKNKIG